MPLRVGRWPPRWGKPHPTQLGVCRLRQGRYEEAETHLSAGYRTLRELRGPEAIYTRNAYRRLVELYTAWDRPLPGWLEDRPESPAGG